MRVDEVLIDRQGLLILRDRIVKLAHLQEQLRVRVIRIRIVGNQLNVFLERPFGAGVLFVLSVRIAEQVEGRRELWLELSGLFVILNRLRHLLLTKVVTSEGKVRALVIRISGD